MIKLVPPIAIDEDTITSNAPADSYPTWGAWETAATTVATDSFANHLWENPVTGDVYRAAGSTISLKPAGASYFTNLKYWANFSEHGFMGMTGMASLNRLYFWGQDNDEVHWLATLDLTTLVFSVIHAPPPGDSIKWADADEPNKTLYFFQTGDDSLYYLVDGDPVLKEIHQTFMEAGVDSFAVDYTRGVIHMLVSGYIYRKPYGETLFTLWDAVPAGLTRVYVEKSTGNVQCYGASSVSNILNSGTIETVTLPASSVPLAPSPTKAGLYLLYNTRDVTHLSHGMLFDRGDKVVSGDYIYHSLTDANTSAVTDTDYWLEYSKVNTLRMFDLEDLTSVTTITTADLTVSFEVSGAADVVALFNTRCGQVDLYVHDGETQLYHETQTPGTRTVVFTDVPTGSGYVLTAVLSRAYDSAVSCGGVMAGVAIEIGRVLREPDVSVELLSFSDTVVDDFGKATFTRRGRSKSVSGVVRIDFSQVSEIYELFNSYDATKCLWVFESAQPFLALFGWYEKFTIKTKGIAYADYTLKVMGAVDSAADDVYNFTVASYAAAIYNLVNTTLPLSMGEELWV